jgi:hypothetical protein
MRRPAEGDSHASGVGGTSGGGLQEVTCSDQRPERHWPRVTPVGGHVPQEQDCPSSGQGASVVGALVGQGGGPASGGGGLQVMTPPSVQRPAVQTTLARRVAQSP